MSDDCSGDLEACRKASGDGRQPFPHQKEAFAALDKVFPFKERRHKAALLVLPTGAGKTFTSVNWICRKVISKGMRVLWLAQSFHLLDQAFESFESNARHIPPPAKFLNIRVVSSHPSHAKTNAVCPTDDVVIVTTQTAISALSKESLDLSGKRFVSKLEAFVNEAGKTGLIVVLDEAHHAPAYGCRNLLKRLQELVPDMALLGLTATPTYTDEAQRGWLGKIFVDGVGGVAYKAEQQALMAQNILAKPVFVEMPTGQELEVDNNLYRRLVQEHKDLPEDLVDKLAKNSARNDYIVKHYVDNRESYGKTIIFADRWFQCVYIKQKLKQLDIRTEAVYSHVDGARGDDALQPSTTTAENAENIRRFKANEVDVLVNVRMLTEGTDVPDTRTVFVTRQTTSSILLTQMIGRALRGKKAGGGEDKDQANIVLFVDKWKHLLDVWATPRLKGGMGERPPVRGHKPMEYIAIHLVEELARRIENPGSGPGDLPFMEHIPVGWYQTEYSVATTDAGAETTERVSEFVMVFANSKEKYSRFIQTEFTRLPEEWGKEALEAEWTEPQVQEWVTSYFGDESNDLGHGLARNLTSIARHMGANGSVPVFVPFAERDQFDLDQLAESLYTQPSPSQLETLRSEFDKDGNLWRVFYKSNFDWFKVDFDAAIYRIWRRRTHGASATPTGRASGSSSGRDQLDAEQWAAIREQVFTRDDYTCQACGAKGKGIKLQLDHIVSQNHGGPSTVGNLQTLCSICNGGRYKGVNDVNFRSHHSPLTSPKALQLLDGNGGDSADRSVRRLVNFFYHCAAVCKIRMSERKNGKNYLVWEVNLYDQNNPDWLLQHKDALLQHIRGLGWSHVQDIVIQ